MYEQFFFFFFFFALMPAALELHEQNLMIMFSMIQTSSWTSMEENLTVTWSVTLIYIHLISHRKSALKH